jgi:hypothetical protein
VRPGEWLKGSLWVRLRKGGAKQPPSQPSGRIFRSRPREGIDGDLPEDKEDQALHTRTTINYPNSPFDHISSALDVPNNTAPVINTITSPNACTNLRRLHAYGTPAKPVRLAVRLCPCPRLRGAILGVSSFSKSCDDRLCVCTGLRVEIAARDVSEGREVRDLKDRVGPVWCGSCESELYRWDTGVRGVKGVWGGEEAREDEAGVEAEYG